MKLFPLVTVYYIGDNKKIIFYIEETNMELKTNKENMGWGILLICFGSAVMLDLYTNFSDWFKVGIFLIGGLVTLAIYLSNREQWLILISAYILLALSAIAALALWDFLEGDVMGSFVLAIIAAPFFAVYFKNKNNWWAMIPGLILSAIAVLLLLTSMNVIDEFLFAPYFLFSIGVTFLVVYFNDRKNWWALIPAYTMIMVGFLVAFLETGILTDMLIPAFVLFSIAIPFFIVYFKNRENWWALIPGGILGTIASGFLLSEPIGKFLTPVVLIVIGFILIFRQNRK